MHYFLGAVSPQGFKSLYPELISPDEANRVYIIKSGPGSGKNTFMRKVAKGIESAEAGALEYIHCSSDPDSLDGVVFKALGGAIVDGTPPHVMEPYYAGLVERYLPLCNYSNFDGIENQREKLMNAVNSNKACYPRIYSLLEAWKAISDDITGLVLSDKALETIARRTKGIIAREIPKRGGGKGRVTKRFLHALTPKGMVCFYDTAEEMGAVYDLRDSYGLAELILRPIMNAAVSSGFDVVSCFDPMSSNDELSHLLIPELGLAFVTSTGDIEYTGKVHRRVRLDAALEQKILRENKLRLRFLKKTKRVVLDEAHEVFREAKAYHDIMEEVYNPYTDFNKMFELVDEVKCDLLSFYK